MAKLNRKSNFQQKFSIKMSVFNAFFSEILKQYNTKAEMCTKFVHAGLAIFVTDAKVAPCYVKASQGTHPGQRHTLR
jgi:hypothetical protein